MPLNSLRDLKVGPNGKRRKLGTILNSQHFKGRKVHYSFGMGFEPTHKQEFKKSTYKTKEKGQLGQVKWKWCNGLNRDNLKHKLYTARNLLEEAPHPSL
jgi:hypothetical protein